MNSEKFDRGKLQQMTVQQIRQAVRKHNLHFAIKGYSKLRKADLIEKFLLHHGKISGKKRKVIVGQRIEPQSKTIRVRRVR